jgi:tRNA(fMet)-specific endonuclease VapC
MIVLDTDAITFLERRKSAVSQPLRNRLAELSAEHDIVTTIITYEEQTRGWMSAFTKALNPQALIDAYDDLLEHLNVYKEMDVIPYTPAADAKFLELRKQKIRIGTRDLRIAAITLAHNATLITRNLRDFTRIPNLRIEDWTKR